MSLLDAAVLSAFPILMAYAAWSDLFTMTISNLVSLALVGIFLAMAAATRMGLGDLLAIHLSAGVAVLGLTIVFFARGWIGGGDAKLAAATAVWLGWTNLLDYGFAASLLGTVLTVAILMLRKTALPGPLMAQAWIARLHARDNGVPYGIALAVAGLAFYPETAVWHAVVGP